MKPPAFQFYADDFLGGTGDMTAAEVGAYIRLLCYQWSRGGLPDDEKRLFLMARTGNEQENEQAVRWLVATKFTKGPDGLLRNERMEKVRAEGEAYRESRSSAGKASGAKRHGDSEWGKKMAAKRTANERTNEQTNEREQRTATNPPISDLRSPSTEVPFSPPAQESEASSRIKLIHGCYSEMMGGGVLLEANGERLWFDWLKAGFTEDDLKRVMLHIRAGIASGDRQLGALRLSNLLAVDRFSEDLTLSKQTIPQNTNENSENNRTTRGRDNRRLTGAEQRQVGIPDIEQRISTSEVLRRQKAARERDAAQNRLAATPPDA